MLRKLTRRNKRTNKLLFKKSLGSNLRMESLETRMLLSTWTVAGGTHDAAAINLAIADGDTISVTENTIFDIDGDTDLIQSLTVASGKTLTVRYDGGDLKFGNITDTGSASLTVSGTMTTSNLGGGGTLDFSPTASGQTLAISGTIGGTNKTVSISDGSILQMDVAASSIGVVTYGNGATLDIDASSATIDGVTPETNGDDLNVSLSEGSNLTITNTIDLDAGEVLKLTGTTGSTNETLTATGGIVLDGAAAELYITGDSADSLRITGNVTADADGTIIDLDKDLTITGTLAMTAGQGDLTVQTGGNTLTATVDVNNNSLTVEQSSGTISTVQMDTAGGILNVDASTTVTNLNVTNDIDLDVAAGQTLTIGTSSIGAGDEVEVNEAGTISNITFDAASILNVDESCRITSLTLNESSEVQIATGKTLTVTNSSLAAGKTLNLTEAGGTLSKLTLANASTLDVDQDCTISTMAITSATAPTINVAGGATLTVGSASVSSTGTMTLPSSVAGTLTISSALALAGNLDVTNDFTLANGVNMTGDATISVSNTRTLTSTVDVNGHTLTVDNTGTFSAIQADIAGSVIDFNAAGHATAVSVTADTTINTGGNNLTATTVTVDSGAELTVDEAGGTIPSVVLTDGDVDVNESNTITNIAVNDNSVLDVAPGKTLTSTVAIANGKALTLNNTGTVSAVGVDSGDILDIAADATVTALTLSDGAIVNVRSGVTWGTTANPAGDITLRGSGTITTLTMADPTKTITKDTSSDITVTTFNAGYSADAQTLTFDGNGKLTIGSAVDFSVAGGQTFLVSDGSVELSADQTLNHDTDVISVASGATLYVDGSITVGAAGATSNLSAASGSVVHFTGDTKTLTSLANEDFKLLGTVFFTGGKYNLAGAFEYQFGDTTIETGAELEYAVDNGSMKFVADAALTLEGTAILDLGATDGSEVTLDSIDGTSSYTIDRGPATTTIDMDHTDIANCIYDSDSGLSAYLDSSAIIANIDFTGTDNSNWTNRAPSTSLTSASGLEDLANVITLTSTENAADDDAFTISYKISTLPAKGTLYQYDSSQDDNKGAVIAAGGTVTDSSGRVVYITDQDGFGTGYTTFGYIAFDSQVESSAGTVTLAITGVNDPPTYTPAGDVTVLEDSGAYSQQWAIDLSAGPGESGQLVGFLISYDHDELFSVIPNINNAGVLTFTPADGAVGTSTITIMAADSGGTLNGGQPNASTSIFDIIIAPVNDAPVLTVPASLEVNDTTVTTVSGISVADVDAASGDIKVSLSVNSGTLSLTEIEGTLTEVNTALAGLTYTRGSSLNDTIRIQVDDQGNTGVGGILYDIEYINVAISEDDNGGGSGGTNVGDNGYVAGAGAADSSGNVNLQISENAVIQAYLDLDGNGLDIATDTAVGLIYDASNSVWLADVVDAATDGEVVQYGWQTMYVVVDGGDPEESTVLVPNRVAIDSRNPLVLEDANGDDIKVTIKNGTGFVVLTSEIDQADSIYGLEIEGGDKASLKISGGSSDELVVISGDIDIANGLKSIVASNVSFEGDVVIDGNCKSIKAADFDSLTITEVENKIQIKVDELVDADIQCDSGFVKLIANSIVNSSISAEDIDSVISKGSAEINITASQDINKISAKGVYSGSISGLTLNSLKADSADFVGIDIAGTIRSISVKNDFNGSVEAQRVDKFKAASLTDANLDFVNAGNISIKSSGALYFENSDITIGDIDKLLLKGKEAGTISGSITLDSVGSYQRAFGSDKISLKTKTMPNEIDSYNDGLFTVDVI